MRRSPSSRVSLWLRLPLLTALLGCADHESPVDLRAGSVTGTVSDVEGRPVQGAAIVLVETATFRPAAGPLATDAQGRYSGENIPIGTYGILIYSIEGIFVHHWTASTIVVRARETSVHDVVLRSTGFAAGAFSIAGTVVDAVTLAPIRAAYVATVTGFHTETETLFRGLAVPSWGSTDDGGRFQVSSPLYQGPGGEPGLEPISVSAVGYEPATLVGPGAASSLLIGLPLPLLPAPVAPDSVLEVEVRLRPAGSTGAAGVVRGTVTHQGEPVVGVRVYLSLNAVARPDTVRSLAAVFAKGARPRAQIRVPLPDATARTDLHGRFEIRGVPPGQYNAAAGYEPDDGYEPEYFLLFSLVTVSDGDTETVSLFPYRALAPLAPFPGEVVASPDSSVELRWEAMPLRSGYTLAGYFVTVTDAGRRRFLEAAEPRLVVTGVCPGPVRWFVSASVRDEQMRATSGGVFERYAGFTLSLGVESRAP